jgi:hypothetical protein
MSIQDEVIDDLVEGRGNAAAPVVTDRPRRA